MIRWIKRMRTWLILALLAAWIVPGLSQDNEQAFPTGDASFAASERFSSTILKGAKDTGAASRNGFTEREAVLRFGAFGFTTTQRLDPATGFPPKERRWGDGFTGILGKKATGYSQSNWSSWWFLDADIRLEGDAMPLPSPTQAGKLVHARIREATSSRIVAEAIWEDVSGGFLMARFTGWRGNVDRFGLDLFYRPPANRKVQQAAYVLTCHPYDYSSREQWWRERWLSAGNRLLSADGATHTFTTNDTLRFSLFNRHAQNTAGVVLALARETTERVVVEGEKEGDAGVSSVTIRICPPGSSTRVVAVLGDWVDEAWPLATARFFSQEHDVQTELQSVLSMPHPGDLISDWVNKNRVDAGRLDSSGGK